jgi:hypothetical protein
MKLSTPTKVLIAGATLWLPIYMIAFFAFMFTGTFDSPGAFDVLWRVHMATSLLSVGLLAFYVVHLFKTPAAGGDNRVLWALTLFFFGPFAMPIYFFKYVW